MAKLLKKSLFLIFTMSIAFVFMIISSNQMTGQAQPMGDVQNKLEGISDEKKAVLKDLFTISQEIDEADRQQEEITGEIDTMQREMDGLKNEIEDKQEAYDKRLGILKQVLVGYERGGPASYLKAIFSAKDLASFIRSISIIRDLTRDTGKLLDSIEEGKSEIKAEREKLSEDIALLDGKRTELKKSLDKKRQLKEGLESQLDSLEGESEYYREQLVNLQQMWDDIKVLFSESAGEFTRIAGEGKIPLEDLNLSLDLPDVGGTIYENTFNDIIKDNFRLSKMVFHFHKEKTEIEVPDKNLSLTGTFSIEGKNALKFQVKEGSFYGMPLTDSSIEELFRDGNFTMDFGSLLGNMSLESIDVQEGYMKFKIRPAI